MPTLNLSTIIAAPRGRVFDLARSIDAHRDSAGETGERAIAGVTRGLIDLNQEVTWEARHFGIRQRLTVRLTECDRPNTFQTVMMRGAFKRMVHNHTFRELSSKTQMLDHFEFESPFGVFGSLVDRLVLCHYMRAFLLRRNRRLKELAESEGWKKFLQNETEHLS